MKYFYVLLFLSFSLCCTAQKSLKHKKEERIEKKLFPKNALDHLDKTLPKNAKEIRYYKKQDSIEFSYKTALKYNKQEYSIRFSEKGILEGVEVIVKQKDIPPRTLEMIKKYLYTNYSTFRIKKIQRYYTNTTTIDDVSVMQNAFSNHQKSSYLYEVITEVKTKKERYFVEIMFTKDGDLSL